MIVGKKITALSNRSIYQMFKLFIFVDIHHITFGNWWFCEYARCPILWWFFDLENSFFINQSFDILELIDEKRYFCIFYKITFNLSMTMLQRKNNLQFTTYKIEKRIIG